MPDSAPLRQGRRRAEGAPRDPPRGRPAGPRHARLRRGVRAFRRAGLPARRRRPGAAGRRRPRPLDHPARDGRDARLQPARAAHPRVPARQVRRLHGLRRRLPGHGHPRPGPPGTRGRAAASTAFAATQADPAGSPATGARPISPRPPSTATCPARKGHRARRVRDLRRPRPLQGLRRMRRGLRGARPRRPDHDRQGRRGAERREHARALSRATCASSARCRRPPRSTATTRRWPTCCSASTPSATSAAPARAPAAARRRRSARWSRRPARSTARSRWGSSRPPAATRSTAAPTRSTRTSCRGRTRCSRTRRRSRWASAQRWDQAGHPERRLWVIGGDGAMFDIGFGALSRMVASGADIKVLVLDTQVYSNTGGQASTASYGGQVTKLSAFGKALHGRTEPRKELGRILMAHGEAYVAQSTPAHLNHFLRTIMEANAYPGPGRRHRLHALPARARHRRRRLGAPVEARGRVARPSRCSPTTRAAARRIAERLSLQGNPALKDDWATAPDGTPDRLPRLRPDRGPVRPALRARRHADRRDRRHRRPTGWPAGGRSRSSPGVARGDLSHVPRLPRARRGGRPDRRHRRDRRTPPPRVTLLAPDLRSGSGSSWRPGPSSTASTPDEAAFIRTIHRGRRRHGATRS